MASDRASNLEKVFWPQMEITKGEFLRYLDAVAHALVPSLRDRPLSVKRYPDGIEAFSFFQKNTPGYAPDFVKRVRLRAESAKRDVEYTVCNSIRTLRWLGNQAAIEFHPWPLRIDRLDAPDLMVFDFDPPPGAGAFDAAVETAFAMRRALEDVGLLGAAKTSGSKGVHVYVPVQRRYRFGVVAEAASRLAERVVVRHPDLATTAFAKADRGGRVLVDIRRNAPGQHTVSPYSPRAVTAATVSFPVPWEKLGTVRLEDFTIRSVPPLMAGGRDPWRELLPSAQPLPRELRD